MASNSDAMDVTPSEQTSAKEGPISNSSQAQIAQKTWEISNFIQGFIQKKFYIGVQTCNFYCLYRLLKPCFFISSSKANDHLLKDFLIQESI